MSAPAAGQPGGMTRAVWLQGLACGAAVTMATPSAVLAGLLLAPGIGAMLLEREPGRPVAKVTLLCGAALAAGPVLALWESGQGVGGAVNAAADLPVLAGCWAAQGAGWLVAQVAPVLVRLALEAHAKAQTALLQAERARHEAEWGIPPQG